MCEKITASNGGGWSSRHWGGVAWALAGLAVVAWATRGSSGCRCRAGVVTIVLDEGEDHRVSMSRYPGSSIAVLVCYYASEEEALTPILSDLDLSYVR